MSACLAEFRNRAPPRLPLFGHHKFVWIRLGSWLNPLKSKKRPGQTPAAA